MARTLIVRTHLDSTTHKPTHAVIHAEQCADLATTDDNDIAFTTPIPGESVTVRDINNEYIRRDIAYPLISHKSCLQALDAAEAADLETAQRSRYDGPDRVRREEAQAHHLKGHDMLTFTVAAETHIEVQAPLPARYAPCSAEQLVEHHRAANNDEERHMIACALDSLGGHNNLAGWLADEQTYQHLVNQPTVYALTQAHRDWLTHVREQIDSELASLATAGHAMNNTGPTPRGSIL